MPNYDNFGCEPPASHLAGLYKSSPGRGNKAELLAIIDKDPL